MGTYNAGCNYTSVKIIDTKIAIAQNSEGRYRRVEKGVPQDFTAEEKAIMVERWRAKHQANLITDCRIPRTGPITIQACENMRQRKGEETSDDMLPIHLGACKECEHATPVKLRRPPISSRSDKHPPLRTFSSRLNDEVSITDAARELKIKVPTARKLCQMGLLEYRKVQGPTCLFWYISKKSVRDYAEKKRQEKNKRRI